MDLTDFSSWLRRKKSDKTISAYLYSVKKFFEWLGKSDPEPDDVDRYLTYLIDEKGNSNSSALRHFYAVKSWFKYKKRSHELEYIEIPSPERKDPLFLSPEEVFSVVMETRSQLYKAAFALQYGCGLRFGELKSLNIDDIDFEENMLRVHTLKQGGQSKQTHTIPIDDDICEIVAEYLCSRFDTNEQLFASKTNKRLDIGVYNKILMDSCIKAGVKTITSHGLRHSRGTGLAVDEASALTIQYMLRHSSMESTKRYIHLTGRNIREHVPKAFR